MILEAIDNIPLNYFHSFTATGNVLCTIDSLGQLYLYRLSPISDPCGPHVPASLQTMFEFCLVSALDWWDLTVCLKPTDVEAVCSRLEENFLKQGSSVQDYYHSRYMSLKRLVLAHIKGHFFSDNKSTILLHPKDQTKLCNINFIFKLWL